MTSARAVKPDSSKKFFVARCPGSARASIPVQRRVAQNATMSPAMTSPTPTERGARLDEEVEDPAERLAVPEALECDHAEADDGLVQRPDDDQRVVTVDERSVGALERLGNCFTCRPECAALHGHELVTPRARPARRSAGRPRRWRDGCPPLNARSAGELLDLVQDRAPGAVRLLVRAHRVELARREGRRGARRPARADSSS